MRIQCRGTRFVAHFLFTPFSELLKIFVGDRRDETIAEVWDEILLKYDFVIAVALLACPCLKLLIHVGDGHGSNIGKPLADYRQAVLQAHLVFDIKLASPRLGLSQLLALGAHTHPTPINFESRLPCPATVTLEKANIAIQQG